MAPIRAKAIVEAGQVWRHRLGATFKVARVDEKGAWDDTEALRMGVLRGEIHAPGQWTIEPPTVSRRSLHGKRLWAVYHLNNAHEGVRVFAEGEPETLEVFKRSVARCEAELAAIEARIAKRRGRTAR